MKNDRGFSLVELLIVIVVIAIVAAIAIPNLLASRRAANEGSAVSTLRTLHGASFTYASSIGNGSYPGLPATVGTSSLAELAQARLIDTVLGAGERGRYLFVGERILATPSTPETFYFSANPVVPSGILMTGTKRFGIETDGVLRYDGAAANLAVPFDAASLPLATPYAQN